MTIRIRKIKISNSPGFSFVELMTVIAIIGILSAVALPSILGNMPEKRLKSAARNLYADLQKARLLAVKENRSIRVRFDNSTSPGFYYFDDDESGNPGFEQWNAGEFRKNFVDYGAVDYGTASATKDWNSSTLPPATPTDLITFSKTGTANNASVYLQSQNNQEICYAVTVTNFGAVKIRRFSGSSWE